MTVTASDRLGGWPALVAAGFAVSLVLIDGFIVSAAAPHLMADFGMGPEHMGWLIGAYVLPLAALPLIFGALGDRFGIRKIFSLGILLLVSGSLLCATSGSLIELVLWRFVQGCGAALISPQTLNAAAAALGAARRGLAIGAWGALSSVGLLLGPILGGLILSYMSWHWIFLVNLPLGLLALAGFLWTVPQRAPSHAGAWTPPLLSAALLALSVGFLVAALGPTFRGEAVGLGGVIAGLLGLYLWARRETRPSPAAPQLVGPAILGSGQFRTACLAAFAMNASSAGTVAVISIIIAGALGEVDAVLTGLLFVPGMLAVAALMPYAGKLAQQRTRLSRHCLTAASAAAILSPACTGLAFFAGAEPAYGAAAAAIAAQGAAGAFILSYASFGAVTAVEMKNAGLASGALSMSRNIGTAIGAATLTGVIAISGSLALPFVASFCLAALSLPFLRRYLRDARAAAAPSSPDAGPAGAPS